MKIASVSLVLLVLLSMSAAAAIIQVPADHASIAAAVAASQLGDEIVIQPATYLEPEITVTHGVTLRSAQAGNQVIIDGGGADVELLVVDHGAGDVLVQDLALVNAQVGCMVNRNSGTVRFEGCRFAGHSFVGFERDGDPGYTMAIEIVGCEIVDNERLGLSIEDFHSGTTRVVDTLIAGNGMHGVFALSSDAEFTRVVIRDNTNLEGTYVGGGAQFVMSNITMTEVEFRDNVAGAEGGCLAISVGGDYEFQDCVFAGCDAPANAQAVISHAMGQVVDAVFNCCELDESQFGGSAWDDGMVAITYEGCAVAVEAHSWSEIKALMHDE